MPKPQEILDRELKLLEKEYHTYTEGMKTYGRGVARGIGYGLLYNGAITQNEYDAYSEKITQIVDLD